MKQRLIVLLAGISALALLLGVAAPALADQPVYRFTDDVTGDVLECGDRLYTTTSGELRIVIHEGSSASGNLNFTLTATPHEIVAVDGDGNQYSIVGAIWFGGVLNANTGGEQYTLTAKLQFIGEGVGTTESVNMTFHLTAQPNNIVVKDFDFGNCTLPE